MGVSKTRISVVAPNWNEMPYFRDMFLESLANQTFKDFEVIIVDGGSIDGSLEAIEPYYDKFPINWIVDETHNIGYIRNVGAYHAKGDLMVQTSSDIAFPPDLLERINNEFESRPDLIALGGRTIPTGDISWVPKFAYWGFDHLRWLFTHSWMPVKHRKMRPAGNFLCIYSSLFFFLGKYPEVKINEDGLFGYKIDEYCKLSRKIAEFRRDFKVDHHVKRFEQKSGIQGILFYIYVFGLFFPWLRGILKPFEERSALEFSTRSDLELIKEVD
jgi:glycosyltransferase involved in cell wall biosynthesis